MFGTVAVHIYLGVFCKTPNCENICALKCFGNGEAQVRPEGTTPTSFIYECAQCHQIRRYEREETFVYKAKVAPPPGWQNGW
jgi:hypothetical protein